MEKGDTQAVIRQMFSKGFISDLGKNKTPNFYADDVNNIRIKNGGIAIRPGQELVYYNVSGAFIQGITYNNSNIYIVQGGMLRKLNYSASPVTVTDIGSVVTTSKVRFITYGIYTIILTGTSYPYVYDGTTLTLLTSAALPALVYPEFGTSFAGFTIVNNPLVRNTLLISKSITSITQANCYAWTGTGSETMTFSSNVLGIIGTMLNMRIFTEKTVEYVSRDNLTETGGIGSLFSIPLAQGYEIVNPDCICGAGDIVFFATKNDKIGSIKYKSQVVTPGIAILSDMTDNSIDGWMKSNVNNTKTTNWMEYDRDNNLVKYHVRTTQSTVPDTVIIRDIQEETRLKDNNKYLGCSVYNGRDVYSGSALSYRIVRDESGGSDAGQDIYWKHEGASIYDIGGGLADLKQYRGYVVGGRINNETTIDVNTYVDDNTVSFRQIKGADIASLSLSQTIGGYVIGGEAIGGSILTPGVSGLVPFEKATDPSSLRAYGKKVKFIFSGHGTNQNFVLDYLSVIARPFVRKISSDIL